MSYHYMQVYILFCVSLYYLGQCFTSRILILEEKGWMPNKSDHPCNMDTKPCGPQPKRMNQALFLDTLNPASYSMNTFAYTLLCLQPHLDNMSAYFTISDVLHVMCTWLLPGQLNVCVGDSSRCSEEIVKNLELRLWMRLLLLLLVTLSTTKHCWCMYPCNHWTSQKLNLPLSTFFYHCLQMNKNTSTY